MLMGLASSDIDITTSAVPEEITEVFKEYKTVPTGISHGTVTVIINGEPLEVTAFRSDGDYGDHRHPSSVTFSKSLEDDLCRRDFTVNAMAYSEDGGVIDLFGGREDLKNRVIRAVGDPKRRFEEDALRILRALRFASQKDFTIEKNTSDAIRECLPLIKHVSSERVFTELKKLLVGKGVLRVLLEYPDIMCEIIPELTKSVGFEQHNPHHVYDVYSHIAHAVAHCPSEVDVRIAALLHDVGKPDTFSLKDGVGHFYGHTDASLVHAEKALERLKCDNVTKKTVLTLIKYHDGVIEPTEKAVKRALNKLGEEMLEKLLCLKAADNLAQNESCHGRLETYDEIRRIVKEINERNECFSVKSLAVNGDDLIALGIPRGRQIGQVLDALLSEVMDGSLENEKETLLARARDLAIKP